MAWNILKGELKVYIFCTFLVVLSPTKYYLVDNPCMIVKQDRLSTR